MICGLRKSEPTIIAYNELGKKMKYTENHRINNNWHFLQNLKLVKTKNYFFKLLKNRELLEVLWILNYKICSIELSFFLWSFFLILSYLFDIQYIYLFSIFFLENLLMFYSLSPTFPIKKHPFTKILEVELKTLN